MQSGRWQANGRFTAFASPATDLVVNDNNGEPDLFLHDVVTDTVARVSVASDGTDGRGDSARPALSADGRHVAFESTAMELTADNRDGSPDVYVHDRATSTTRLVSHNVLGDDDRGLTSRHAAIVADGSRVVFESDGALVPVDANAAFDVYRFDLAVFDGAGEVNGQVVDPQGRPLTGILAEGCRPGAMLGDFGASECAPVGAERTAIGRYRIPVIVAGEGHRLCFSDPTGTYPRLMNGTSYRMGKRCPMRRRSARPRRTVAIWSLV